MIAQTLADVETGLAKLIGGDIAVDALYDGKTGRIETVFISTYHDPSVGIFGGRVFTLWWALEEPDEGLPHKAEVVGEDRAPIQEHHRKRWGPPEEWEEEWALATGPEAERIVYRALMDIHMRPF